MAKDKPKRETRKPKKSTSTPAPAARPVPGSPTGSGAKPGA